MLVKILFSVQKLTYLKWTNFAKDHNLYYRQRDKTEINKLKN